MGSDNGGMDISIRDESIRLGQLLKLAGIADDGTEVKRLLADELVSVDGDVDTRRGRQVLPGHVVTVDLPAGALTIQVISDH